MLRDKTSAREVPFRDVHDSITTTVKCRDLAGRVPKEDWSRPRGERKFLTGLRRPASSMPPTRRANRRRSENSVV